MKLLLIGNELACPDFINYANERKLQLTVISEKNWKSALDLDCRAFHEILSFSDTAQILVERIKTYWGVPGRGEALIDRLTNKKRLREHQHTAHLFPPYGIFSADSKVENCEQFCIDHALSFPLVVKPTGGFYSAGVSRIDDASALPRAISLARRINNHLNGTKGDVIIEEYLCGKEIAIDGIIYEGNIYPLIYHSKYPKLEGPFFHEEAYISQTVQPNCAEIPFLKEFIQTLGLRLGPFHIEMRQCSKGKWYLLECAPRLSGMGLSTNIPFFTLTGKHAYDFLLWPHLIETNTYQHDNGYMIEFDFSVKYDATITGLDTVITKIRDLPNSIFFQYIKNGQYV
ncbi:MAG TPA: ATP-grasp domain-containing protein, partial [Legionellaceae bacterium]|nr:ATP-grasp domain-containing protein [Legionellaceae bacterium]